MHLETTQLSTGNSGLPYITNALPLAPSWRSLVGYFYLPLKTSKRKVDVRFTSFYHYLWITPVRIAECEPFFQPTVNCVAYFERGFLSAA